MLFKMHFLSYSKKTFSTPLNLAQSNIENTKYVGYHRVMLEE